MGPDVAGHGSLGPYVLLGMLGHGGMGEVWRARDTRDDRVVALKVLAAAWSERPEFRRRFEREARATAALDSAHVITIQDYGEIDGRLYIEMPLIAGGDLGALLADRPEGLEVSRAVLLTDQVAQALGAAHRAGLVHRDVKPSNVLLGTEGGHDHAYLVDFGIARLADDSGTTAVTATGDTPGTPAYMAPELFTGADAIPACDVYALGCVLFEMLTGHRPYRADTNPALIAQHLYEPIPHVADTDPDLAPYDPVITRALAKTPDQRYPTARTFARALRYVGTAPEHHRAPAPTAAPIGGPLDGGGTGGTEPAGARGTEPSGEELRATAASPEKSARSRLVLTRRRGTVLLVVLALLVVAGVVGVTTWSRSGDRANLAAGITATAATGPLPVAIASSTPESIAFSPDGRRAYVVQTDTGVVSVVDTANGHEIARVVVPEGVGGIAVDPGGSRIYVTGYRGFDDPGTRLSIIDTATNTVIGTAPAGINSDAAVLSPDGTRLYASDFGTVKVPGTTVSVVDTTTDSLSATIPVGFTASDICRSPDGTRLYVVNIGLGDPGTSVVTVIDTATGRTNDLPTGSVSLDDCAVAPDGRRLFVAAWGAGTDGPGSVQVIDTVTGTTRTFGTFVRPEGLAVTPDGKSLIITDNGTDQQPRHTVTLADIATGAPRQVVTLGCRPVKAVARPDGLEAWVSCTKPDGVWRVPLP